MNELKRCSCGPERHPKDTTATVPQLDFQAQLQSTSLLLRRHLQRIQHWQTPNRNSTTTNHSPSQPTCYYHPTPKRLNGAPPQIDVHHEAQPRPTKHSPGQPISAATPPPKDSTATLQPIDLHNETQPPDQPICDCHATSKGLNGHTSPI